MVLSFKQQFVQLIIHGDIPHSIREDRFNKWKAGMMIHFATGVRTANCNVFRTAQCTGTQIIEILPKAGLIFINGEELMYPDMRSVMQNEGHHNLSCFYRRFNNAPFRGKIIHWTALNYEGVQNKYTK